MAMRTRRGAGRACSGRCGCRSTAQPVDVRGPKRRAVLALLALARGPHRHRRPPGRRAVAGGGPGSARQALHTHVSRLRAHLGPAATGCRRSPDGYRLELGADDLDVAQARALLRAGGPRADPAGASRRCGEAHALWRGPVLADLDRRRADRGRGRGLRPAAPRRHRRAGRGAVDAGPAPRRCSASRRRRVAADPLREPAVLLLMRALAATGQAPEALRVGAGVPPPAGRGDRPGPVAGAGRARTRRSPAARPARAPARPEPPARPATRLHRPGRGGRRAAPAARRASGW